MQLGVENRISYRAVATSLLAGVISLLISASAASAETYYIATNGSDGNSGTSTSSPFASFRKAASIVRAGDTVQVRGGTYRERVILRTSGTFGNYISFMPYNGEPVVIDAEGSGDVMTIPGSWIRVRNFSLQNGGRYVLLITGDDNVIERVVATGARGHAGVRIYEGDRNVITHTLSYNNYDGSKGGEDADGFSIGGDSNLISHCRAYNNSDDGFDAWGSTRTTIQNSAAHDNGYGSNGDGNGFKLSNVGNGQTLIFKSSAFRNLRRGITGNNGGGHSIVNNTATNNPYNFQATKKDNTLVNNVSEAGKIDLKSSPNQLHNSWNLNIANPKFLSKDITSSNFLRLASDSPCRNSGTKTGVLASATPDLGAFQYGE